MERAELATSPAPRRAAAEGHHAIGDVVVAAHAAHFGCVLNVTERHERGHFIEAHAEELFDSVAVLEREGEARAVLSRGVDGVGEALEQERRRAPARDEDGPVKERASVWLGQLRDHSERIAIDRRDRLDLPRRGYQQRLFDLPRPLDQRQHDEGKCDAHGPVLRRSHGREGPRAARRRQCRSSRVRCR